MTFVAGQRWNSLTEPELGLGVVELVEDRQVVVRYPARDVVRRYGIEDAPLMRVRLAQGQIARPRDGAEFRIEQVEEIDSLLLYHGAGQTLTETCLDADLDVASPENRLRMGQVDDYRLFDLRQEALTIRHQMLASPARGFLGASIKLFDHQLSIARDVCDRHRVRVLLADEVGLGKTIEALLILHRMLLTGRVERALVMVPPALVHQWLAEAYLRFNLVLRVLGRDTHGDGSIDLESEDLPSELLASQLFVCPLGVATNKSFTDAEWDLLIVDEAHHLEPGGAEFELVAKLTKRVDHVLILSATPDRDGEEAHFRRLGLLDSARFQDLEAYREEAQNYQVLADTAERLQLGDPLTDSDQTLLSERLDTPELTQLLAGGDPSPSARRTLLSRLLDLHGIGRVMFRNVRARIPGFPRRFANIVELDAGDPEALREEFLADLNKDTDYQVPNVRLDPRAIWVREFLANHPEERVLVLCSTRAKTEAFAAALAKGKREVARFHEDMSSIERDRQAGWFLAADGPQVLVSSAIGAEGRNFQVASNLVLLDLPLAADRLEQLIGRIDRIGQGEEVRIHCIVRPGTPQARLAHWFDQALKVFDRPWHGSPVIAREFDTALLEALLSEDESDINELIKRATVRNQQIVSELENGRDRLLELTSFDIDAAFELRETIQKAEQDTALERFMFHAFDRGGLDIEEIGKRSYAIRTGPDYHRPFPGFIGNEMGVTFDRATALDRPELALLTWDHPMVRDTLDTMLAHDSGNACVAQISGTPPGLLLECIYVAEPTAARELRADRFFPPTPIRIVVDVAGREVTSDAHNWGDRLKPMEADILETAQIRDLVPTLQEHARSIAMTKGPAIAATARTQMHHELATAVQRLSDLDRNSPVDPIELAAAHSELEALNTGLTHFRLRLEGLRLIMVTPN